MCIFNRQKTPKPTPLPAPPPVVSRINPELQESELPARKDIIDEDEVTGVEYGSSRKTGGPAAGKKTGTGALRIPLNTGTGDKTASSGGVNV
tara:strand:+ start:310 stop:585 length:276 start_codon:yes stop_codon:yes gene_type:complete